MEATKPQLDQLLTFHKVALLGSISAAADDLGLSQPAISVQMRNLATAIGEPILKRYKGGVTLTPVGKSLLPYASQLVRLYGSTCDFVDSLRAMLTGSISIASSNTIAAHLLPSFLANFNSRYPEIGLSVAATNSQGVVGALRNLEADVGFIEGPVRDMESTFETHVIGGDSLVLVYGENLKERALGMTPIEMLGSLPLVFRERGSGTRKVVEDVLESLAIKPNMVLELAGTEAVKEAVLSGIGASVLSSLAVRREVDMGYLSQVDLGFPGLTRDFCLVIPIGEHRSRTVEAFAEEVVGPARSANPSIRESTDVKLGK